MSNEQGDALWPKGKVGGNYEDKKQHKPVRIPFPKASDPKKLMPIRCPLPDHDKHSGMPLRFGIGVRMYSYLHKFCCYIMHCIILNIL